MGKCIILIDLNCRILVEQTLTGGWTVCRETRLHSSRRRETLDLPDIFGIMPDWFIDILKVVLPGLVVAIVTSILTVRLSIRRFYEEKWWERKERAYSDIIASLNDIMQYYEYQRDHYEHGRKLSKEREKEIKEQYSEAYWKLKKVTDIGGFVISRDAAVVLKDLRNRPKLKWDDNPPGEIYDSDYEYYKLALDQLVAIANKELKAKKA